MTVALFGAGGWVIEADFFGSVRVLPGGHTA